MARCLKCASSINIRENFVMFVKCVSMTMSMICLHSHAHDTVHPLYFIDGMCHECLAGSTARRFCTVIFSLQTEAILD